jgi:hypothetical protein
MKLPKLSFPNWPMKRLLQEACRAHNALHPDTWANPETTNWELLYALTIAFLRHELSLYEQSLREGDGDREQLRIDISKSARKFYPWLRKDKDPRTIQSLLPQEPVTTNFRIFSELSAFCCDLRSRQDQLVTARRKCRPGADRKVIDDDLAKIRSRISMIDDALRPDLDKLPITNRDFRSFVMPNESDYCFAGRQLPFSYIKPTAFSCDTCQKLVWRSKVAIDLGAGIKLVVFSCHCISFSVTGRYTAGVKSELWHYLVTGEKPLSEEGENELT